VNPLHKGDKLIYYSRPFNPLYNYVPGSVRADAGVLEPGGERQARLQGDPPLPPEEEPRLLAQVKPGGRQDAGGRLRRLRRTAQEDYSVGSGGGLRRPGGS
jgi:hypothetical protein